jgi:hypothetical protein
VTTAQQAALRTLSQALEGCQKIGIALFGMDNQLYAVDADEINGLPLHAYVDLYGQDRAVTVPHAGAYRDSGGW